MSEHDTTSAAGEPESWRDGAAGRVAVPGFSRYDSDPDALAWARTKIRHEIDRCLSFHGSALRAGKPEQAETWRRLANRMEREFIGGEGCTVAAFDARLPALIKAIAAAEEPTP